MRCIKPQAGDAVLAYDLNGHMNDLVTIFSHRDDDGFYWCFWPEEDDMSALNMETSHLAHLELGYKCMLRRCKYAEKLYANED